MKRAYILGLFVIFCLAYILRVMYLPKNVLTFGYDQTRDANIAGQILDGDVKVQGPPASTPGLYHGVFYYYLLAPAHLIGGGNPITAAYWIAFLNTGASFIVFYLAYLLSKKWQVALLAAFLFAISFESTQYATWLSNPTIATWTVPLMYLGLWAWIKSEYAGWRRWGPIIAGVGLGLSIQAEIFLVYHLIPLITWLVISKKSIERRQIFIFIFVLILSLSTMILNEIKVGFRGFGGIALLAQGGEGSIAYAKSIGDYLILYLNQIGRIFAFNTFPGNVGYGGAFVIILTVVGLIKSDKVVQFLSTWLFSHITVVTVGGESTPFLMAGIGPAVSILVAYYLYKWWDKKYKFAVVLVLLITIYGNLSFIFRENLRGSTLFAIQKDMLLSKQLTLIDYTYQKAGGGDFSINSLTSPLWINIVWTYLYKWYGETKYGYLPSWHGRDQVGQLDRLEKIDEPKETSFLILEPMGGIPPQYLDLTLGEEDSKSVAVEEKYFGELRVQKRVRL